MIVAKMADQLMDAATSVGANYRASSRARSRAEFVAKLGIVAEEIDIGLLARINGADERRRSKNGRLVAAGGEGIEGDLCRLLPHGPSGQKARTTTLDHQITRSLPRSPHQEIIKWRIFRLPGWVIVRFAFG